ncbi:mevalonate kinase [Aulographum hederae CBS 113979]|uniref:Mevalonate kinase n=1 Tax=Aulographum hederae CBS 113979 TaxID=1176131 RepID=A0A6G1GNN0_9PEZI|nr:mevalonate kinase [Aulographum hederae CBS 113979]
MADAGRVSFQDNHNTYNQTTQQDSRPAMAERKNSTPLMPAFMVSAPGKVIVYGEHAVVYGKAAIAAAISLRSYLLVHFLSKSRRTVSLRFPDISLDHTWCIDDLPWDIFATPGKKRSYYDLVTSLDPELIAALQPHLDVVSPDAPEHIRKIHQSSVTAFLYLFLSLGTTSHPPCVYTLRSTIPIGAGLGSSASIAVCLSTALLIQIRALSGPHNDQPAAESALQIERINRWAFVAEMCIHGNPSGVDNTVASGGKAVLFQRIDYTKPPIVLRLNKFPELPLLLVNTRQSRSTAVEVAKVGKLREKHPAIAAHILDAINDITATAHELISSEDFDEKDPTTLKTLGELASVNHGLLVALGVSHPKLERIRALIDHAGIGWTKLTGAGGGGCAITLLRPDATIESEHSPISPSFSSDQDYTNSQPISPAAPSNSNSNTNGLITPPVKKSHKRTFSRNPILKSLETKLANEGFEQFETTLAGDGVGVLMPAVLMNGSGEEGGEEIDQGKFLRAEGSEGIEALVGVGVGALGGLREAGGGGRGGWGFWRY